MWWHINDHGGHGLSRLASGKKGQRWLFNQNEH